MVVEPAEEDKCPHCHGTGRIKLDIAGKATVFSCWYCDQTGKKLTAASKRGGFRILTAAERVGK